MIVALECLFSVPFDEAQDENDCWSLINRSVLKTGILPSRIIIKAADDGVDISGLANVSNPALFHCVYRHRHREILDIKCDTYFSEICGGAGMDLAKEQSIGFY